MADQCLSQRSVVVLFTYVYMLSSLHIKAANLYLSHVVTIKSLPYMHLMMILLL